MTAPDLVALAKGAPIHFMGIGGAGMSALAELVLRSGGRVTGCDSQDTPTVRALREAGARVDLRHDPGHVAGCAALVVTAAVPADHPEMAAASAAGIPVLKRAEALGSLVNRGQVVGVAGTHGKTSTTAMTVAALSAAGLDPTGFIGGRVPGWVGGLRLGANRLFVVEADEYDRSFLHLRPTLAVVTTLEADHLDIYGTLERVEDAFAEFAASIPEPEGALIACADDSGVGRLLARLALPADQVVTYGLNAGSQLRAEELRTDAAGTRFAVREAGERVGTAHLGVPGLHNVRNALAAAAVTRRLGGSWEEVFAGLAAYQGVERRFQRVGEAGGVLVIDDYAHHPTEVAATLHTVRLAYPGRRLIAAFQPHLYSRTRDFAAEFGRALTAADQVVLGDIYAAREKPIAGITGELIASAIRENGGQVHYVPARADLVDALLATTQPGDVCITLGAGDLNVAAREFLARVEGVHAA